METLIRVSLTRFTSAFPLAGKLIEWKLLVWYPTWGEPTFPLAGKLIEWKLASLVNEPSQQAFPLAGKLIEWKRSGFSFNRDVVWASHSLGN